MKNWKLIVVILAIFGITVAFITCDDNNNGPCNCLETYGTTEHLGIYESCTCGGKNCDCKEQEGAIPNTSIKIRKEVGISVGNMNTAVANIQAGYNMQTLTDTQRDRVSRNVSQIHIVTEENAMDCVADGNGKFIITADYRFNDNSMRAVFSYYSKDGDILHVE